MIWIGTQLFVFVWIITCNNFHTPTRRTWTLDHIMGRVIMLQISVIKNSGDVYD